MPKFTPKPLIKKPLTKIPKSKDRCICVLVNEEVHKKLSMYAAIHNLPIRNIAEEAIFEFIYKYEPERREN